MTSKRYVTTANGKFAPKLQGILDKVYEGASINAGGRLVFDGSYHYDDARRLLCRVVSLTRAEESLCKDVVINKAIKECVLKQELSSEAFLSSLNDIVKKELKVPNLEYSVLTEISIKKGIGIVPLWKMDGVEISFHEQFPEMFKSRSEWALKQSDQDECNDYTKVVVRVFARTPKEALGRALKQLEVLRALMCFEFNDVQTFSGMDYPVNKVRLGRFQTVHDIDGNIIKNNVQYQVNFERLDLLAWMAEDSVRIINKNIQYELDEIRSSRFRDDLEVSLTRYVAALDEKYNDNAIVRLWGAIENIMTNGESNCDKVANRISAMFKNDILIKDWVLHIQLYRNEYVHQGKVADNRILKSIKT